MRKIVEYGVVIATSPAELAERVEQLLPEGWQPQGGLTGSGNQFHQAMVKYEPEQPATPRRCWQEPSNG